MRNVHRCICALLIVAASSGCATWGNGIRPSWDISADNEPVSQPPQSDPPAFPASVLSSPPPSPAPAPSGPQLVIPATGGPPEVAQPLGGNLFAPVAGGPPVVGFSTSP
jgi:hypothetical protein